MAHAFWIVGTDTDIGKTFVTAHLMRFFQSSSKSVLPYKPIQTGLIAENNKQFYGDTEFYKSYSSVSLTEEHLNSYSFKEAASPHYAAKLEGKMIEESIILKKIEELQTLYDYVICEGAGGLFVPLDDQRNYQFIHLIKQSGLPVVLVTRTGLGTINHTLLSVEALKTNNIPLLGLVFNGYEGTNIEKNNIETITQIISMPSLIVPKLESVDDLKQLRAENTEFYERISSK
ncbi:dethiobiotin synthase [Bacillus sp. JJ722]|uniref:dethiobiotin synthase n=1 Tax=Bacillus sp. JJ722 TaxID=3122973 RepID=UPI002FFFA52F